MDAANRDLATRLTQLKITRDKTEAILAARNSNRIKRHKDAIHAIVSSVEKSKRKVEELKIAAGEEMAAISTWCEGVEADIAAVDQDMDNISTCLSEIDQEQVDKTRKEQLAFEKELLDQKFKYNEELGRLQSSNASENTSHVGNQGTAAKLPKLAITKFNGTNLDWTRFWGQFTEGIDKSGMAAITKFSYLKEFVVPTVRRSIDCLPFTADGYERAKGILCERYGNSSEVEKAYVVDILDLPKISGNQPRKIHQFYERLLYDVQSLETMGKLSEVNGNVALTIDKLSGIRGDLVRNDENWQSWDFLQLCEALKSWTRRNPVESNSADTSKRDRSTSRVYNTRQQEAKTRVCVYCEDTSHRCSDCPRVTTLDGRKKILAEKRLCFNCTGPKHRAAECTSKMSCYFCSRRHHTSICTDQQPKGESVMSSVDDDKVIYPVVVVKVGGIECRALLDSGASSCYASAKLLDMLGKQPTEIKPKKVVMLMASTTAKMEIYKSTVSSKSGDYHLEVNLTKVNRGELLSLENPRYEQLMKTYSHLKGVEMDDIDTKPLLPVHVILGAGVFARIKTDTRPRIGNQGEPVAERTKLGWIILSPGEEIDTTHMLLTQTSHVDYEELCKLDVLGLEDTPQHDQGEVYMEFREQLSRNEAGWYEAALPWKGNHPPLSSNKQGSLRRLENLKRKLERIGMEQAYSEIIEEQKAEGVVEAADQEPRGVEFYIPHKPVIREEAVTTKVRVVYDASAKAHPNAVSLNDCLYPGPPLQNKLWNVLVRSRTHPVAVVGDLKKAFLQVRIKESDRDALRFHWKQGEHSEIETLRFTRALFGLAPSPFLLGGVIKYHLDTWEAREPHAVAELRKSLYVDDLISGGVTVEKARELKQQAIEIFEDATFTLHKWQSNEPKLEENPVPPVDKEGTFAKQQLVKPHAGGSSLLGLGWDKERDEIIISFPEWEADPTKRGVLRKLASIYDPLGFVSPVTLVGKCLYRDVCCEKLAWDAELTGTLKLKWQRWEQSLPKEIAITRALVEHREPIQAIQLHGFGDASSHGVGAVVYAVVRQESGITQRLVAAKARLAKQGLTIPRLELISAHMVTNLLMNVKFAMEGLPVTELNGWLDSTVALFWINGGGQYKQFVENRVQKIRAQSEIIWRHVPTKENPADLASRGGDVEYREMWWEGPEWMADRERWPPEQIIQPSVESTAEAKATKELFALAVDVTDRLDAVLEKFELNKAINICAWISRFLYNSRYPNQKLSGPLTTKEKKNQQTFWVKRSQQNCDFQDDRLQLNLQPNQDGILECRGRIQGVYPIYLPDKHLYTQKLVHHEHLRTLHGGVGLTMTSVRRHHWVPRLRKLAKRTIRGCHGCQRFQARAAANPPPGNLPVDRTQGSHPFQIVGVDYAGPIKYRKHGKVEAKAYIVLYACSLCRALYLDLVPSLETQEFILSLKKLIARKGRPEKIYSDNGKTFVGAARWLRKAMYDEKFNKFLAENEIIWQFNLSRAPWWGGQFERMVGLVKNAFYKTIGCGLLSWAELEEVLLDVEITLNDRPLSYVEDDVALPILTLIP